MGGMHYGQLQAAGLLAFPCRSAVAGTSFSRPEATSLPADKFLPEKDSLSKRELLDIHVPPVSIARQTLRQLCQAVCLLPLTSQLPQRLPAKMGQLSSGTMSHPISVGLVPSSTLSSSGLMRGLACCKCPPKLWLVCRAIGVACSKLLLIGTITVWRNSLFPNRCSLLLEVCFRVRKRHKLPSSSSRLAQM